MPTLDPADVRARVAAPLTLPGGAVLPNRFAKAAMEEGLGDRDGRPTEALATLYGRWARSGCGLLITGNVMVDARARGEWTDVVLENDADMPLLKRWAAASTDRGVPIWMQINHPGRQCISPEPVAPSAVPMGIGYGMFQAPRALTGAEIEDIVARFAKTAAIARAAGFSGVQLHGAHGYLISQFLSPRTNQRTDDWGGSPEKRMRFLLAIVSAVRAAVGPGFPIGVKLNSADFQKGGFSEDDSLDVVRALDAAGVDLLEVSGGTYEASAMMGVGTPRASTLAREAYFLAYAERVRQAVAMPIMLTGGLRSVTGIGQALADGVDVIGLARPLAQEPDWPARVLSGASEASTVVPKRTGLKDLDGMVEIFWYQEQIRRMGEGREPDPDRNPWFLLAGKLLELGPAMFDRRRR